MDPFLVSSSGLTLITRLVVALTDTGKESVVGNQSERWSSESQKKIKTYKPCTGHVQIVYSIYVQAYAEIFQKLSLTKIFIGLILQRKFYMRFVTFHLIFKFIYLILTFKPHSKVYTSKVCLCRSFSVQIFLVHREIVWIFCCENFLFLYFFAV